MLPIKQKNMCWSKKDAIRLAHWSKIIFCDTIGFFRFNCFFVFTDACNIFSFPL